MQAMDVWSEVGATMRHLRRANGASLRDIEALGTWRRGSLSQVETGKARPSHALIEFYDTEFGGDGLLASLFAEAHVMQPVVGPVADRRVAHQSHGDAYRLLDCSLASGTLVAAGTDLEVRWRLRNCGAVIWQQRSLCRIGATAGSRLIASAPCAPVPDTDPGGEAVIKVTITSPTQPGTVAAHWQMTDAAGRFCFSVIDSLSLTLVVA